MRIIKYDVGEPYIGIMPIPGLMKVRQFVQKLQVRANASIITEWHKLTVLSLFNENQGTKKASGKHYN
jgi:hypothetical protein